jgi:hypothetical protein
MRATFITAILVAASLMAGVALTSAQKSAGDQEKGSTGLLGTFAARYLCQDAVN